MTFMDVLSQWLDAYGGRVPLGFAMAIFAGSYSLSILIRKLEKNKKGV